MITQIISGPMFNVLFRDMIHLSVIEPDIKSLDKVSCVFMTVNGYGIVFNLAKPTRSIPTLVYIHLITNNIKLVVIWFSLILCAMLLHLKNSLILYY